LREKGAGYTLREESEEKETAMNPQFFEDKRVAYHEAGHAVMAVINKLPIWSVHYDSDGAGVRLCWWAKFFPWNPPPEYKLRMLEFILAGPAAEAIFLDMTSAQLLPTASGDHYDAARIAGVYNFPLPHVRDRTERLLRDHEGLLDVVALRLLKYRSISGREVCAFAREYFRERPHLFPLVR
jgi:hypothetical protein